MRGISVVAHTLGQDFLFKEDVFPTTSENLNPFRLFRCDAPAGMTDLDEQDYPTAFLLGSFPANVEPEDWTLSLDFPAGLDTSSLYPQKAVAYTTLTGDEYEVCMHVCVCFDDLRNTQKLVFVYLYTQHTYSRCCHMCVL